MRRARTRLLPSAIKLRRLCFYRHLSVHRGWGWGCLPQYMLGYHTPGSRHPPWRQTDPAPPGHPLQTPALRQKTPPETDTPHEQTPPWSRHPAGSRHPPEQTPPQDQTPPPEIRSLLRTVRILLECILVKIMLHILPPCQILRRNFFACIGERVNILMRLHVCVCPSVRMFTCTTICTLWFCIMNIFNCK